MTREQAADERIREWLHEESAGQLPDWVLDATFERTRAERQRRSIPGWRFRQMHASLRIALAATVVVAAMVGLRFASVQVVTPGAVVSQSPSTTPAQLPDAGALQPGSYRALVDVTSPLSLVLTVPGGWSALGGWAVLKNGGEPPDGTALSGWLVKDVFADECRWSGGMVDPPVGPSIDDLVTALTSQRGRDATAPMAPPTDVLVDGFLAKHLVLAAPSDIAACDLGQFKSWTSPDGGLLSGHGAGQRQEIWIVDAGGVRLLILAGYFPQTSPADLIELHAIVDTIDIVPAPAPTPPSTPAPTSAP